MACTPFAAMVHRHSPQGETMSIGSEFKTVRKYEEAMPQWGSRLVAMLMFVGIPG